MSTHTIGSVRLLLGTLLLLLAGVGGGWWLWGRAPGQAVLALRGGEIEIAPWDGQLRGEGSTLAWETHVSDMQLLIFKAATDDGAFVPGEPIALTGVKRVVIDVKSAVTRVEGLLVINLQEGGGATLTVKEGSLLRKGDVWVHSGFTQNGQRLRYEIAKIECRDASDRVVSRYENPDLGRAVRFLLTLKS